MPTVGDERQILITGGAGFVGSHLCERLLGQKARIVCLDNFCSGSHNNIAHLLDDARFELIRHDVTQPISLEADEIFNLACVASPSHYQRDPVHTLRSSVCGAINMLDLARRAGAKILQTSTSEVYGDPQIHPQPEEYWGHVNPIGQRACYNEGKRCAETLFFDYRRQYQMPIKVARIFNTYGPRMQPDDGRVVSSFITQALRNEPVTIYGTGEQTRSFCYIDDLIDGLVLLMGTVDAVTGPMNLGNPAEITIRQLAEQIIELTGSRSRVQLRRAAVDDPQRRRPDIRMARATLAWEPRVPLGVGLMRTIEYFDALFRSRDGRRVCA
jgi:UDP-glucuronate decarboxylase